MVALCKLSHPGQLQLEHLVLHLRADSQPVIIDLNTTGAALSGSMAMIAHLVMDLEYDLGGFLDQLGAACVRHLQLLQLCLGGRLGLS